MVENREEHRCEYWATRSSVRSFARTAHSFACSGLLASLAPSAALTCSLASSLRSLPRSRERGFLYEMNCLHTVSTHCALPPSTSFIPLRRSGFGRRWRRGDGGGGRGRKDDDEDEKPSIVASNRQSGCRNRRGESSWGLQSDGNRRCWQKRVFGGVSLRQFVNEAMANCTSIY